MHSNDPRDQLDPNTEIGRKNLANIQSTLNVLQDVQFANKIDAFLKEREEYLQEKMAFEQEIELHFFLQKAHYNQSMQEYLLIETLSAKQRLQENGDFLAKQLAFLLDVLDQKLKQLDSAIALIDQRIKILQEARSHAVENFVEGFKAFLSTLPIPQFESSRDEHDYKAHLEQALYPVLDRFKLGQILPKDLNAELLIAKNKIDRIFFPATNLSTAQQTQLSTLNENISGYVAPEAAKIQEIDRDIETALAEKASHYKSKHQIYVTRSDLLKKAEEAVLTHKIIEETPKLEVDNTPPKVLITMSLRERILEKHKLEAAKEMKLEDPLKADSPPQEAPNKIDVKPLNAELGEEKASNSTQKIFSKMDVKPLNAKLEVDNPPPKILTTMSLKERILEKHRLEAAKKMKLEDPLKADSSPQEALNKTGVKPLTPLERVEAKEVQANEDHQPAATPSMRRR